MDFPAVGISVPIRLIGRNTDTLGGVEAFRNQSPTEAVIYVVVHVRQGNGITVMPTFSFPLSVQSPIVQSSNVRPVEFTLTV